MATASSSSTVLLLLLCTFTGFIKPFNAVDVSSPYLSPTTLFLNYQKMLTAFRIYIYNSENSFNFSTPTSSLFHKSLLNSPFVTRDPNEAHLFYVPFSSDLSARSIARLVKQLRIAHPYWNRTLGADHFYVASAGINFSSDRNGLELKKNSVQISDFPTTSGYFIPHKDITLPPITPSPLIASHRPANQTDMFLCYLKWDGKTESSLVHELQNDAEFIVESEPSDHVDRVKDSKFCLFLYNGGDVSWMAEALTFGCVPVVLVDRSIQDLPLMDVLQWSQMALLVRNDVGAKRLKTILNGLEDDRYLLMKKSGMAASKHLLWNAESQPQNADAFYMVMYQLWLRRHTIRYARREE